MLSLQSQMDYLDGKLQMIETRINKWPQIADIIYDHLPAQLADIKVYVKCFFPVVCLLLFYLFLAIS